MPKNKKEAEKQAKEYLLALQVLYLFRFTFVVVVFLLHFKTKSVDVPVLEIYYSVL